MVARRWPHFISATAIWIAIVVFPEPPFSFPTTMTCGELRDFTAAFSMAAPRNNQLREGTATTAPGGQPVRPVRVKLRDRQLTETTAWGQHCSSSLNSNSACRSPDCPGHPNSWRRGGRQGKYANDAASHVGCDFAPSRFPG